MMTLLSLFVLAQATPAISMPQAGAFETLFAADAQVQDLEPLRAGILQHTAGKGFYSQFVELKKIAALRRPLKSQGYLVYLPQKGLARTMEQPFRGQMVVTPQQLYERTEDGQRKTMAVAKQPLAKAFVDAFLTLFSGSEAQLKQHFQLYLRTQGETWQLGLVPLDDTMAKVIQRIVMSGNAHHLETLTLLETSGDSTHSKFFQQQILEPEDTSHHQAFAWTQD